MPTPHILALPADVLLTIFTLLDVVHIVQLERTCRFFHSLARSRSLWLHLLKTADQTSFPNFPPHINPSSLSVQELRDTVVPAARFYSRCLKGKVKYEKRVTASLSTLTWQPEAGFSSFGSDMVKFLPGGQYLLISNSKIAHILDLKNPEQPIWTRTSQALSLRRGPRGYFWISHIACEMCPDGSITAVLVAKSMDVFDQYYAEVHRLRETDDVWESELAYSHDCECRDDDDVVVSGDYIVCPGVGHSSILNWKKRRIVTAESPSDNSVAEALRPVLWRNHLFFVSRSFYVIAEGRFNFQLNALFLPPYFSDFESNRMPENFKVEHGRQFVLLESPEVAIQIIPHPADVTLVQLSAMTISDHIPRSKEPHLAQITVGAKFWEEADRTHDFFSIYDYTFDPSPSVANSKRFSLQHNPTPLRHPLEETNTLVGYTSGVTAFSNAKSGILLHSTYRLQSFDRLSFFLSVIGIDKEGALYFAQVDEEFREYLAANRNRCRVPVEEYSGALVFLAADSSSVDIWYPA